MSAPLETLDKVQTEVIDIAFKFGPKVLVAIFILIVGFLVGRWVGGWTGRMFEKLKLDIAVRRLLERIVRLMVLGLFVIIALQNLGVELLPLLAGLGVAGAGIAFAMQGVLGNIVAGLTIVFTRPFSIGEYISIVGEEGQVEDINTFSTTLSHPDKSRVVIPNRKIVGDILHNYGTIRQLQCVVGVAYDTNLNEALAAINEVLRANARVLAEPAPVVRVSAMADSAISIVAMPWVNVSDYGSAFGEINKAIVEKLRERRIAIPCPQREVRMLGAASN
ncbi:MAG: mechanosensitive ion channel [Planctomycetes bacterium]|nr:mechanosensitive ion channel [Planctomycetota bacterium]